MTQIVARHYVAAFGLDRRLHTPNAGSRWQSTQGIVDENRYCIARQTDAPERV
jgi:hypothetical protein